MENIGVHVLEGNATRASSIASALVSNVGLLIESVRGVPNTPIRLTSASEARKLYGNPSSSYSGALVLRGLFNNAASYGATVYAVRIIGDSSAASALTITSGDTQFISRVVGTASNSYAVTIETGTNSGTKVTIKDDVSAPTVTEIFDDIPTAAVLREAINVGLPGYNSGAASTIMKIGYASTYLPDILSETTLSGGTTTVYASLVTVYASAVDTIISGGQKGLADPGTWGDNLSLVITPSNGNEELRDVFVYLKHSNGEVQLVETWRELSATTFATKINNSSSGSSYIYVSTVGDLFNSLASTYLLSGAEGAATSTANYQGVSASGTGLYAFDSVPVHIIAPIDDNTKELAVSLETYCQSKSAVGVVCPPYDTSFATLLSDWEPILAKSKSFLAGYRGWVNVSDESGGTQWIPNSGHVIGAGYIRKMMSKGGYPHIAPAGNEAYLLDCNQVEIAGYTTSDLEYVVHTLKFNPVMYVENVGFVPRTSRTFSTLSKNYSVHVRRSIIYLINSISTSISWVEQASNNQKTRNALTDTLTSFFRVLYTEGMFNTDGGYANNVSIQCDSINNPDAIVNERRLVCDIIIRFVEIAESVEITLEATQEGITATLTT